MKASTSFATLLAVLLTSASSVYAQLNISIALERNNYVCDEAIIAVVKVENRSGKAIALGGPGGQSWLQFDLKRADGGSVNAFNGEPKAETTMLKDGASISRPINLANFYPVNEPGSYLISCSVYFSGLQRWLGAPSKSLFTVNSPKTSFWERTVGMPKEHPQANRYRRYKLFTNKSSTFTATGNLEQQLLYVRISDEETGDNVVTFHLGPILTYRDPQPTTDKDGNLCVLYMSGPQMYQYIVLDVDGAIKEQQNYRPTNTSPGMVQTSEGRVLVRGGQLIDAIEEETKQREQAKQIKSLADRPQK